MYIQVHFPSNLPYITSKFRTAAMFVIEKKDVVYKIHKHLYSRDVDTKCHTPDTGNSFR